MRICIHDYEQRYMALLRRIEKSNIMETDKRALLEFSKEKRRRISAPAITRYANSLNQAAKWLKEKRGLKEAVMDDIDDVVYGLGAGLIKRSDGEPYSLRGIHDIKVALKVFYKWLNRPEIHSQITSKKVKILIDPAKLWTEGEINRLISSADGLQNQALIAITAESAARIGEIGNMRISDVKFGLEGLQPNECLIQIDGKTGPRNVLLIWSTAFISRWLEQHPKRSNPNTALWINRKGEPCKYSSLRDAFKKAAKNCGVNKPSNPHIFRKSMTTILRRKGYDSEIIKKRNGWTRSSQMLEVYEAISNTALFDEERKVNGMVSAVMKPSTAKLCPFCGVTCAPAALTCSACGEVIDLKERERRVMAQAKESMTGYLAELLPEFLKIPKKKLEEIRESKRDEIYGKLKDAMRNVK